MLNMMRGDCKTKSTEHKWLYQVFSVLYLTDNVQTRWCIDSIGTNTEDFDFRVAPVEQRVSEETSIISAEQRGTVCTHTKYLPSTSPSIYYLMFFKAFICVSVYLSVCLFVNKLTQKFIDGFAGNFQDSSEMV